MAGGGARSLRAVGAGAPVRRPVLTRRLTLEVRAGVPDGGGGERTAWAALGTLWAELRPSRGRESVIAAREASSVTHRLAVRHASPGSPRRPHPEQRMRLGARVFDVVAVAEHEVPGYLTVWVREGVVS